MPRSSAQLVPERDAIRSEVAEIVTLAGADGRNIKECTGLAARKLGLTARRVKAFRLRSADAWGWELDRLRRARERLANDRAARLQREIDRLTAPRTFFQSPTGCGGRGVLSPVTPNRGRGVPLHAPTELARSVSA